MDFQRVRLVLLLFWLFCFGSVQAKEAGGQFLPLYLPPKSPVYQPYYEALQGSKALESTAQILNSVFILPNDVNLVVAEVGSANAFYSPEHHTVVMSYELLAHFFTLFQKEELAGQLAAGAFFFVMFHELGHCLIHELKLPAVGKEEDAVDEFATLLLLQAGEQGELAILGAAVWFATHRQGNDSTPYWDEHSLDMQRFYGIFTLLYATNPTRYEQHALDLGISRERLAKAKVDYQKKDAAWAALLQPHIRSQLRK